MDSISLGQADGYQSHDSEESGRIDRPPMKRKPREAPVASSLIVRERMMRQRQRDTQPELAIRKRLHRLGLRYRVDFKIPGLRRRADIAFPRRRVAVFIDGCFWHCCPEHGTLPKSNRTWWRQKLRANVARDRETDTVLSREGWTVVRIWEHEEAASASGRVVHAVEAGADPGTR